MLAGLDTSVLNVVAVGGEVFDADAKVSDDRYEISTHVLLLFMNETFKQLRVGAESWLCTNVRSTFCTGRLSAGFIGNLTECSLRAGAKPSERGGAAVAAVPRQNSSKRERLAFLPLAGHRTEPGRFRAQEQAKREQESESLHAGQTAYRNRIWTRDFQASFISHSHKRAAQSASSAARSLPMAEDPRLLIATTDAGSALYAGVDGQPNGRAPCLIRFSTSLALHGLEALSEELARNLKNSCAQPTLLQSVRHGCQFKRDHARSE